MKVACTFRIDSDVLQSIVEEAARLSVSEGRKVSQAEVIERAFSGEAMDSIQSPKTRKQSKRDRLIAELEASDPIGAARDDVELGNFELPRGGSISQGAMLDATGPKASDGRGKVSVQTWRAGRKPLLRPKERK